jgi:hypothetical protein
MHFYPIWEAASVDEWLYNGGPYQLIILHFLLGVATAFATALRIAICVNLMIQKFSHLNCPLAYFTIVISWDFSLRCESCVWWNSPFGLVS